MRKLGVDAILSDVRGFSTASAIGLKTPFTYLTSGSVRFLMLSVLIKIFSKRLSWLSLDFRISYMLSIFLVLHSSEVCDF